METPGIVPPFEAYRGDEPCLFVSYSHRDSERVFPELVRLRDLGYRIWYDEGIPAASEWPEEIARALERCAFFLVFVTPHAAESRHVRNEMTYAVDHGKPFLAVHLSRTQLPPGLSLQMSNVQAVMQWQMGEEAYRRKVAEALPERLLEGEARQRHLARLQQLSELQHERPLWRDELLEVASRFRAIGNETKAVQAETAAGGAAARPQREQLNCPHCGAAYTNAYKVRCEECGGELPPPPQLGAKVHQPSSLRAAFDSLFMTLSETPEVIYAVALIILVGGLVVFIVTHPPSTDVEAEAQAPIGTPVR